MSDGDNKEQASDKVSMEPKESDSSERRIHFPAAVIRYTGFKPTTQNAEQLVGDSIYVFFLTKNPFAIFAAVAVFVVQVVILTTFGLVDWQSTLTETAICHDSAVVCEEGPGMNAGYMFLMILLLLFHTGGEVAKGLQLIVLGGTRQKDTLQSAMTMLLGLGIGALACCTVGVAVNFVSKKSDNFVSRVQDIFILLFVLDCDEKVFDIVRYWNPECVVKLLPQQDDTSTTSQA